MRTPETFEQRERRIFEATFPMEEIRKIEQKPNRKLDPFKTLSRFGMNALDTKEARDLILAEISATPFGPQINMIEENGEVRIFAHDIEAFLIASYEIYFKTVRQWTDETNVRFLTDLGR